MKIIFSILFILGSLLDGNLTKPIESNVFENAVSYVDESFDDEVSIASINEFNGSSIPFTLGLQTGGYFTHGGAKLYFSFTSSEQQYVKLNYTGPNAVLYVYNSHYYSSGDYLQRINSINYGIDIIYMDMNQTYIFEFLNTSSSGQMTINAEKLDVTFEDHEKYILHLDYDSNSSIGYHYSVEYFDVSLTEANDTPYNIYTNTSVASYIDLISDNINFNYTNDDRRLVSQPGYSYYSAISAVRTSFDFIGSSTKYRGYATGTFIDETTVISCAHMIYTNLKNLNDEIIGTSLIDGLYFYPGANSYPNNSNYYIEFGKYAGLDTYVPISFELSNRSTAYDWSLTLTEQIIEGLYEHSYMGLLNFTGQSVTIVENAGYPCVSHNSNYDLNYSMWASYPIQNYITTNDNNFNVLESNDIVISSGNSGGPLFISYSSVVNGVVVKSAFILGISDASSSRKVENSDKSEFNSLYACRIRSIIINIYSEVR